MSTSEDSSSSSDSDMSSDSESDDESDNSQTMNRPKVSDTHDSKSESKASKESNAKSACCLHNIAIQGGAHNLHAVCIILLYKEESIIFMLST